MKNIIFKIAFLACLILVVAGSFVKSSLAKEDAEEISLLDNIDLALSAEVTIKSIDSEAGNDDLVSVDLAPVRTLTGNPYVEEMVRRTINKKVTVNLSQMNSIFFTEWERRLLLDARNGFVTRSATEDEIDKQARNDAALIDLPRGPREIVIGGIIYHSSKEWTVWLNGQKIQPDRLPPEILDIQVQKDYVKLKWFDGFTNQVFPIKLKTHQRFNIDTKIFLPG